MKADVRSSYWFGISQKKLDSYRDQYDTRFNIILFGGEEDEGDFYCLPFIAIKDLLIKENLYFFEDRRTRWVGDIRSHILRIRNCKIERNISEYFSIPKLHFDSPILQKDNLNDYAIENAKREVKARVKQSIFRKEVLENFNRQCCLTGVDESQLLVASHIIPWSAKIDTRLSPYNGLCLSILYDSLFDSGYFTFNDSTEVVLTPRLHTLSKQAQQWLTQILGREIAKPKKYEVSKSALEYHRTNIFDRFKVQNNVS